MDITRDVMRGLENGKELKVIRTEVEKKYSSFGPATNTEPIQ